MNFVAHPCDEYLYNEEGWSSEEADAAHNWGENTTKELIEGIEVTIKTCKVCGQTEFKIYSFYNDEMSMDCEHQWEYQILYEAEDHIKDDFMPYDGDIRSFECRFCCKCLKVESRTVENGDVNSSAWWD